MFGKVAADVFGLSDIGKIIKPEDFDKFREIGETSLNTATAALGRVTKNEINLPEQLKATNEYAYQWLKYLHKEFSRRDFGEVFEKYINS